MEVVVKEGVMMLTIISVMKIVCFAKSKCIISYSHQQPHFLLVATLSHLCNFHQLEKLSKCSFNCTARLNHFSHWAQNPSVKMSQCFSKCIKLFSCWRIGLKIGNLPLQYRRTLKTISAVQKNYHQINASSMF